MIYRCPDCIGSRTMGRDCPTCKGSRYVRRNGGGRIVEPATAAEFVAQERKRPFKPRPLHYGKPSKFR